MAENEDGQEKSHEPTSKRLADARKKGQVPRSKELNTMALTILGVASIMLMGGHFSRGLEEILHRNLTLSREQVFDTFFITDHLVASITDAVIMILPFFAIVVVIAILASVALGGFNVSFQPMEPKLSKLDPIKGMKKVFSAKGLMELVKSLAKFILVSVATYIFIAAWTDEIIMLSTKDANTAIAEGLTMIGWAALLISCTMIVMAIIDVPFQLWNHKKELKMTDKEVRDEMKETEGKPEVKGRIRQMQREMANARMMAAVPQADVIVTNPTHYAVALKYDPENMSAPVVIALGKDLVAANIRRIGAEHEIDIIEAPELARAIYFSSELNEQIPAGLFLAVAQLLAYVFQLKAYRKEGGDIPVAPDTFPVPDDLKHD